MKNTAISKLADAAVMGGTLSRGVAGANALIQGHQILNQKPR
jgi:hypothetical protein